MSLRIILKNLLQPLPDTEKEADKFFELPLNKLFFYQIQELVRALIDEARVSRAFGLFIEPDDLEKEELFFLAAVNTLGGIQWMRRKLPREAAHTFISETMWSEFSEEVSRYFDESKARNESVTNKYNCHLECMLARLLREIYDAPNPKL